MAAWNSSNLKLAHVLVIVNTHTTAKLPPMDRRSTSSVLTHSVSRPFAGIGVFGFLHNESVAFFKDQSATTAIKVLTGLGFGLAGTASGWNLGGGCLVYDLVALAVGRKGDWRTLLSFYGCWSC
jgi:hypothetical protein